MNALRLLAPHLSVACCLRWPCRWSGTSASERGSQLRGPGESGPGGQGQCLQLASLPAGIFARIGWVTQRMLVKSGLEVRLLLGKSLQNLWGMSDLAIR